MFVFSKEILFFSSSFSTNQTVPEELLPLADRYSFKFADQRSLQRDIIELKRVIRCKLNKQMRIKQGYVQMQVIFYLCLIFVTKKSQF